MGQARFCRHALNESTGRCVWCGQQFKLARLARSLERSTVRRMAAASVAALQGNPIRKGSNHVSR